MRGSSKIKIAIINLAFLEAFIIIPGVAYKAYEHLRAKLPNHNGDQIAPQARYPTYADRREAEQIYRDESKLSNQYRSFIGWRKNIGQYKSIKIQAPYSTRWSLGQKLENSVWFFGGSTMWGSGSTDRQTIPSLYWSASGMSVFNFGEAGWNSRQSLNQLISLYGENKSGKITIFYDGVNEVLHQCRREHQTIPAHEYEHKIRKELEPKNSYAIAASQATDIIMSPYLALANKLGKKLMDRSKDRRTSSLQQYDCNTNNRKRKAIAKQLVQSWRTAYLITKSSNSRLIAILQPTIYTSNVDYEYLVEGAKEQIKLLRKQYSSVYPEIQLEMQQACYADKDFCRSLIDGTGWLRGEKHVFTDFCHISPKGNKIIALNILRIVREPNYSRVMP